MDNLIQPFQLETSHLRGRLVRLGDTIDTLLAKHAYPEPVAELLAEAMVLAAALASALKYDGIFTLQFKGDGPVGLLVADITSAGAVRGYAQYDAQKLEKVAGIKSALLLGRGYLAFTVDQGPDTERYQGIVEISGRTLADCAQYYFKQSEQLETGFVVHTLHSETGWRAGCLMLQRMPGEGGIPTHSETAADDWQRSMVLMSTLQSAEMGDLNLSAPEILYRLFHEEGVRIFEPKALTFQCRCSRERVHGFLKAMTAEELADMKVADKITVTCEFCSSEYAFTEADILMDEDEQHA